MSREIKFIGKRIDNGELVYGSLLCDIDGLPKEIWYYLDGLISYVRIIPESVGQFTGLKDKNGVDIYEGDILSYYNIYSKKTYNQIVKWNKNLACFALFQKGSDWAKEFDWEAIIKLEVIGNIHETKK